MNLEEAILKEWKEHKNKYFGEDTFECENTYVRATFNYMVGATITDHKGKVTALKTKKEAEEYGKKERKKMMGCTVCNRFQRLLSLVREKTKEVKE